MVNVIPAAPVQAFPVVIAGPTGSTGSTGPGGPAGGPTGATGATGAGAFTGPTGATGQSGVGSTGPTGATGIAGVGLTGPTGAGAFTGPTGGSGVGSTGPTGAAGSAGTPGIPGVAGATGPTGPAGGGATGAGLPGPTGPTGAQGSVGAPGTPGAPGTAGATGPTGAQGSAGTPGTPGGVGATGPTGAAGSVGTPGTPGSAGATGPTGAQGSVGTPGSAGATGPTGAQGTAGTPGTPGTVGATGPTGAVGSAGTPGGVGATGATGATGTAGVGAVRYDIAQGLTANQQAQARSNIGDLKKNYVLNGAMMVSQENGNAAGTVAGYFPVDQFKVGTLNTSGTASFAQVASPTPGGSPNRLRFTVTAADASMDAADQIRIQTAWEGLRVADLKLGTANAKTVILQFGVKAPAGTYCVAFWNGALNRSYVAEYVITPADVVTGDVVKSVTVPLDIPGAWVVDSTVGLYVSWALMAGSNVQQAAGSWTSNVGFLATANQFNFMGTAGNVFELFDVGLYEGNVAPPFMVPDYASELAACMRHWERVTGGYRQTMTSNGCVGVVFPFKVTKRAQPTCAFTANAPTNSTFNSFSMNDLNSVGIQFTGAVNTESIHNGFTVNANARL